MVMDQNASTAYVDLRDRVDGVVVDRHEPVSRPEVRVSSQPAQIITHVESTVSAG
jgi:hypothetical protein